MPKQLTPLPKYFAIAGNTIFVLWILYNGGIEKEFNGSVYQKISIIILVGLLVTNIVFLVTKKSSMEHELVLLLRYAAIIGNVFFILWMLYNGINEGFKAPLAQKCIYLAMFLLLAINIIFLSKRIRPAGQ